MTWRRSDGQASGPSSPRRQRPRLCSYGKSDPSRRRIASTLPNSPSSGSASSSWSARPPRRPRARCAVAAGVDPVVGDADLLDFFEVEEALAVGQGVQGHHAEGWFSRLPRAFIDHPILRD